MIFAVRGTTVSRIWPRILVVFLFSLAITGFSLGDPAHKYSLTAAPFTVIGLALAIFLGFRNSAAYDRYWEGRKLWGRMVNVCRSFTMQINTLIQSEDDGHEVKVFQHDMVMLIVAYINALRHRLRDTDASEELWQLLGTDQEISRSLGQENVPAGIADQIARQINRAYREGWLDKFHVPLLHTNLTEMLSIQGGCERIKSTPIPYTYSVLTHRTVLLYCLALPCGLHDTVGLLTPIVVGLVAYAFLGLDAVGDEVEQPFGTEANHLPLLQLTRMIEINVRQLSDHEPEQIPPPIKPTNHILN